MNTPVIAVIFDFDDTLGPDSISHLLSKSNISPKVFWEDVKKKVKEGFDPPLAYMGLLLDYGQKGKLDLSQSSLRALGQKIPLFPGLPQAVSELKQFILKEFLAKTRISLEFYIVSGGLEEMIRASTISKYMNGIFGSNFSYDSGPKIPKGVKSAVSFTEKTRYIFGINKGLAEMEMRQDPYRINDAIPARERRVPFDRMIYIGDGPSDIPCLSLITSNGGTGIGVSSPTQTFRKGYELARGKRLTVGPYTANFTKGSDLRKVLEQTLLRIGLEIIEEKRKRVVLAPAHD